ncbi:hypothetical protein ACGF1Z_28300 [Streptomyces sp. NPDC048018]|uniref:hypothetical protein n=1 Tax=Streptomyces sp. NPDC048018 TaxID=3365499 RepID=UPI00371D7D4E
MGGDVLLASKWELGIDLLLLLRGLIRFALMDGPAWIRYPVIALGSAFVLYVVGSWCRERWLGRGEAAGEETPTRADS